MKEIVPILLYHSIAEDSSPAFQKWVVSPFEFKNQMRYLYENEYTPFTVSEFVALQSSSTQYVPQKPVLITFDDGFEDFYTNAVPIMAKYDFASTLYITTSFINGTSLWLASEGEVHRKMLTQEQVQELPFHRVECGAHTHTHPQLDLQERSEAKEEIMKSKTSLESYLNLEVKSFAYPHGHYDQTVRSIVKETGFSSACAVKHAMSHWEDDSLALSRIIIPNGMSIQRFGTILQGQGLSMAPQREHIRTKLGRLKRRIEQSRRLW